MNESTTVMDRVDAALARFTERERLLIGVMILVVSAMAAFVVAWLLNGRMNTLHEEIAAKRDALTLLINESGEYRRNSEVNEELRRQLEENDIRLSTFIEGRGGRAGISRPREFRDNQTDLEGGVTMHTTTAEFDRVDLDQLQRLLSSIEESDELVFTRQVAVAPARREQSELQLEITLATFKREGGE